MKKLLALFAIPFVLTACGSDDEASQYKSSVELSSVSKGVAQLQITITDEDGNPASGDVKITPVMNMTSGMIHSTPLSISTGELDTDGQFATTAYFLMPSGAMGSWSVEVSFNNTTTSHAIDVDMMMSDVKQLKGGEDDQIAHMDTEVARTYYLFDLGRMVNNNMNAFSVFVAARESLMNYQPITDGAVLNAATDYELSIGTVVVEMCSQSCENESNWQTAMEDTEQAGVYQAMNLNLNNDENDVVEVRLSIGGSTKTSDGTLEGNNASFTFSSESSMPMAMM